MRCWEGSAQCKVDIEDEDEEEEGEVMGIALLSCKAAARRFIRRVKSPIRAERNWSKVEGRSSCFCDQNRYVVPNLASKNCIK